MSQENKTYEVDPAIIEDFDDCTSDLSILLEDALVTNEQELQLNKIINEIRTLIDEINKNA